MRVAAYSACWAARRRCRRLNPLSEREGGHREHRHQHDAELVDRGNAREGVGIVMIVISVVLLVWSY
jgi:hypothetical protein